MSFSFTVRGATKALVLAALAVEMEKVVEAQPIHQRDAAAVKATAETYVGLLPDSETQDISVAVHGSVSWRGTTEADTEIVGASVGVNAHFVARE